jgi:hypothetical protein
MVKNVGGKLVELASGAGSASRSLKYKASAGLSAISEAVCGLPFVPLAWLAALAVRG